MDHTPIPHCPRLPNTHPYPCHVEVSPPPHLLPAWQIDNFGTPKNSPDVERAAAQHPRAASRDPPKDLVWAQSGLSGSVRPSTNRLTTCPIWLHLARRQRAVDKRPKRLRSRVERVYKTADSRDQQGACEKGSTLSAVSAGTFGFRSQSYRKREPREAERARPRNLKCSPCAEPKNVGPISSIPCRLKDPDCSRAT